MSPLHIVFLGQVFFSGECIRSDHSLGLASTTPWGEVEKPLFGQPRGKIGVEVEITLPTGSWTEFGMQQILNANVNTIKDAVSSQMADQGISADVVLNDCKCFVMYDDNQNHRTLPFLITVNGVADYQKFGTAQLGAVTTGLYEQLTSGISVPQGASFAAATNATGKPIKNLKAELEENPALDGAVESVSLRKLQDGYNGMTFSDQQFLLEVELGKYDLISTKVAGFRSIASLAGQMGAGKSEDIVKTVYSLLAEQLVAQIKANGINILISTPEFASQHFSKIGGLTEGAAEALHAGGRSVVNIGAEPGTATAKEIVDLDKAYPRGLAGDVIPPHVTQWKRTKNKEKLLGFRLVMTVTSVNEHFFASKLPVLRDGVAETLRQALPENLKELKLMGKSLFDPTVTVKGCGWKPELASEPPFPHDEAGCREPPGTASIALHRNLKQ